MGKYGLPYQGSKSAICDAILKQLPNAENFYDLFGGGGAVSHAAVLSGKYKNVFYNEIDSKIARLFEDAMAGKYSYESFKPQWVSREEFQDRNGTDGYIALCWSFSNDQRTYMFGKNIEQYKKSMHQAVVFGEFDDLSSQVLGFDKWDTTDIKQRRLFLRRKIEGYRKAKIPDVLLPFLNEKQLQQLERLEQLQQLQQLLQLERLQQLERLEGRVIIVSSKDYRDVSVLPESIVYCDIPYESAKGYSTSFDRQAFLNWAADAPFPVYISEYEINDPRFLEVFRVEKRKLMCGSIEENEKAIEKLYCNGY